MQQHQVSLVADIATALDSWATELEVLLVAAAVESLGFVAAVVVDYDDG